MDRRMRLFVYQMGKKGFIEPNINAPFEKLGSNSMGMWQRATAQTSPSRSMNYVESRSVVRFIKSREKSNDEGAVNSWG